MTGNFRHLRLLVLFGLATALPAAAQAACSVVKIAELPVTMEDMRPTIPVKVNGQDAQFELDTGAWFSMLGASAADRLKVSSDVNTNLMAVTGVGGEQAVRVGLAHDFVFAGHSLKNLQFIVGGEFGAPVVGLLGDNFLRKADVEYDLANGVVRFWDTRGCDDANLAYWAQSGYNVLPLDHGDEFKTAISAQVRINGQAFKAVLDTGSSRTIISEPAARRAGIQISGEGVTSGGIGRGVGARLMESWTAPVDSFEIGNEQIRRTRISIGRMDREVGDVLLGADFFLSHRVMVSNRTRRLFFTYNGGPVFKLDQAAFKAMAPGKPDTPVADGSTAGSAPGDASEFSRRGAASLARQDLTSAIASYSRAIELDPNNATRYFDRAKARWQADDKKRAREDIEAAIRLKPDYADALVYRGSLRLADHDETGAKADFVLAEKSAPGEPDLLFSIANSYEDAMNYPDAISMYDDWIKSHQKSVSLWTVLNNRCWARAMWGRQLDQALDDCNASLKHGGRSSMVLDSRGMVRLRMGDYAGAIQDYDTVLKLQPKMPWSLYGRGLARQRMGDAAGGEADIKASTALDPSVPKDVRKFGIVDDAGKLLAGGSLASNH